MVKRKIDIKLIENKAKRYTAFTKRRHGLEKKAKEFFELTNSKGAVIIFSKAGNCNVFANPDVQTVLNRYETESSSVLANEVGDGGDRIEVEARVLTEAHKRIGKAVEENGQWNEAVRDLGVRELDELFAEVKSLTRELAAEIAAVTKDLLEGESSSAVNKSVEQLVFEYE